MSSVLRGIYRKEPINYAGVLIMLASNPIVGVFIIFCLIFGYFWWSIWFMAKGNLEQMKIILREDRLV